MNWKEFLRPTKEKIFIFLAIFIISFFISPESRLCNPTAYGFPLKFFQFDECFDVSPCIETAEPGPHIVCESIGFNNPEGVFAFIIDILFWYLVSCFIVSGYKKSNKKKVKS